MRDETDFIFSVTSAIGLWPGHRVPGDMPTKHPAAERAGVFQRSCNMQRGPRAFLELCEVPVIVGTNSILFNYATVKSVFENYLNEKLFSSTGEIPTVIVMDVTLRDDDQYEIKFKEVFSEKDD